MAFGTGDCLVASAPPDVETHRYLESDVTVAPCAKTHQLEVYAPGYTVGGIGGISSERCGGPEPYRGWKERVWRLRLTSFEIVSSRTTTGDQIRVYCAMAVRDSPIQGQYPQAVDTKGSLRGDGDMSRNKIVGRYGACLLGVPDYPKRFADLPCEPGQSMWLEGSILLDDKGDLPYPGPEAVMSMATARCDTEAASLIRSPPEPRTQVRVPDAVQWSQDRGARCYVWYDAVAKG
jgi:hypothetical protein